MSQDWIGWIAMAATCISFVPKDQKQIRILNSIACVIWIAYALAITNWPMFGVNSIVLIIHFEWFRDKEKENG